MIMASGVIESYSRLKSAITALYYFCAWRRWLRIKGSGRSIVVSFTDVLMWFARKI
jgi:hypothetical protein